MLKNQFNSKNNSIILVAMSCNIIFGENISLFSGCHPVWKINYNATVIILLLFFTYFASWACMIGFPKDYIPSYARTWVYNNEEG
jgi:hypothetical protein